MNDLSSKVLTVLSGMCDIEDKKENQLNPLNRKIFYLFDADNDGNQKKKKKKNIKDS